MKIRIGLAVASLVTIFAECAVAVDITGCGQSVPAREVGVLTTDLLCDPGERGVTLTLSSTLDLNGHDIVAPDGWAVWCEPGHRCTVIGNGGEIRDAKAGVYLQNRSDLRLSDVTIRNCEVGIQGEDWHNGRKGAKARLTNVTVIGSSEAAISAGRVTAEDVSLTDNPGAGLNTSWIGKVKADGLTITGNATSPNCQQFGCEGLHAGTFVGKNVIVSDNAGIGIRSKLVRLKDSTVTGNIRAGSAVDILSDLLPRLRGVTCDRAAMAAAPLNDWGVCRYDGQF